MKFRIEMIRKGPDATVLVTLSDGDPPQLGSALQDNAGKVWRVVQHLESEVVIEPGLPDQKPPRYLVATTRMKRVHAA